MQYTHKYHIIGNRKQSKPNRTGSRFNHASSFEFDFEFGSANISMIDRSWGMGSEKIQKWKIKWMKPEEFGGATFRAGNGS